MKLIGINGLIGSGKSTLADCIEDVGYEVVSFAGPLKDATAAAFGWPRDLLEGDTDASRAWREREDLFWRMTPRLALQKVGTEAFRQGIDVDFWVKALMARLKPDGAYVISDMRFPNEFEAVKNAGGKTVRIWGPDDIDGPPSWWNDAIEYNRLLRQYDRQPVEWRKLHTRPVRLPESLVDIHQSEWASAGMLADFTVYNKRGARWWEHLNDTAKSLDKRA